MLKLNSSTRFRKDYKICVKRGYDMRILNDIVDILRKPDKLPEKNKDHNLTGNLKGYRECHIMPDWLLITKYLIMNYIYQEPAPMRIYSICNACTAT